MDAQSQELTPEILQQQPLLLAAILLVFGLMMVFVSGGIGSWIYFGLRAQQGQPVLPIEPWRPRLWGLADMLVILIAIFLGQTLFVSLGVTWMGIDTSEILAGGGELPLSLSLIASLGNVAALFAGALWIQFRFAVPPSHVGLSARRLPQHLLLGLMVGLATLPLIYVMMIVVSVGLDTEYAHPLIEQMTAEGSLSSYLIGVVTAALLAPLAEEFLFRGILQGWMQSIPFKSILANIIGGDGRPAALLLASDAPTVHVVDHDAAAVANSGEIVLPEIASAEISKSEPTNSELLDGQAVSINLVPPVWPSVVTGTLFGLAHWGYGLSFLPLIVLGIILGLVYRATHSIWPCVLIHFMLNGTSMAMLGVVLLQQQALS